MGNERTGSGSSRDALKNRSLHLKTAGLVEVLTHGSDNLSPLDEYILNLRIHYQVNISLTVAEFRVSEGIEDLSVKLLHDRKHAQGLAQQGKLLGMDAELTGLGEESETLDSDNIPYVKEFLPDGVVHGLVLTRANLIPLDINLNASRFILELSE